MSRTFLYLHEVLPDVEPDFDNYAECERTVISPALVLAGYTLRGGWYTGDGDSFGPLTRCINTDEGTVVYG